MVDTKIMLDNKSNVFVNTLLSKNARLETCTGAYIAVCDRNACCCHVTRAISRKASYLIVEAVHRIAKICNFKSMPRTKTTTSYYKPRRRELATSILETGEAKREDFGARVFKCAAFFTYIRHIYSDRGYA